MQSNPSTCWELIEAAAAGQAAPREEFARRYEPVVRAYLAARWGGGPLRADLDDAVQEVFVECFRERGVLQQADADRPGGFRAYLYGVCRNVALRCEQRRQRRLARGEEAGLQVDLQPADEERLSHVFDRAWAYAAVRRAAELLRQRASGDDDAIRRVELLRLRFEEDRPIRDIAAAWSADATHLHREYARARREFREALLEVLAYHLPNRPQDVEAECASLLGLLA